MSEEIREKVTLKDIIKTFKLLPRTLGLLWDIKNKYLIIITLLSVFTGVMPILNLKITQSLINNLQKIPEVQFESILLSFVLLIAVSYLGDIIQAVYRYYDETFRCLMKYKLSRKIMKKANELQLKDFETPEVYDKIARAEGEATSTPYELFMCILNLITNIVTLIGSLAVVFLWKPWTVGVLAIVPIISVYYYMKLGHYQFSIHYKRATRQRRASYISFINTHDFAIKEIKLYKLGSHLLNKYTEITKEFYKEDKQINKKKERMTLVFSILTQLTCDFIVLISIISTFRGEILIGDTIAFIRAISLLQSSSEGVVGSIFKMYSTTLYIEQLFEFLDMEVEEKKDNEIEIKYIKEIEFKNVYFRYRNQGEYVLKDISFKVSRGERLALVGVNGSGKTTLVKLISGLYKQDKGEIYVNGINTKDIKKESLQKCIGVVFQDFNKYEFTLKENITLGNVDDFNNEDSIKEACKSAEIEKLVDSLPNKMDSQLGLWFTDGNQLSGGQWQKIAIARAFYRNASMYILDEPSSFLDPKAERELFIKFSELTNDRLSIFITHRFINTNFANRIMVLENGEVVEDGTRDELIENKAYYYKMYSVQQEYEGA